MLLGLDYGEKNIGLAVADENSKMALPYKVLINNGEDFILKELKKIIIEEKISKIIVGLPNIYAKNVVTERYATFVFDALKTFEPDVTEVEYLVKAVSVEKLKRKNARNSLKYLRIPILKFKL